MDISKGNSAFDILISVSCSWDVFSGDNCAKGSGTKYFAYIWPKASYVTNSICLSPYWYLLDIVTFKDKYYADTDTVISF